MQPTIEQQYKEVYQSLDYGPIITARGFIGAVDYSQSIPDGSKILCAGSGNSYEAVWFKTKGYDVYTLDYHHPKVECLKGRQIKGEVQSIPFNDNEFDFVLCAECLEHVPEKEVNQALQELHRVCKPSKPAYFTVSDEDDPPYHTHLCIHGIEWWMRRLRRVGFTIICAHVNPEHNIERHNDDGSTKRFVSRWGNGLSFRLTKTGIIL